MSTLELLQLQNEHKTNIFYEKGEDFLVSELNKIAERQSLAIVIMNSIMPKQTNCCLTISTTKM